MEASGIIFSSKAEFEKFVDEMGVDKTYNMPEGCRYKALAIRQYGGEYSWTAVGNHKVSGIMGTVRPLTRMSEFVANFPTPERAKRDLKIRLRDIWKD